MIYALHAVGTEFIKFGVTRNIERRLAAHQVSCPHELAVVATAPWPDSAECRIHNLLRSQCVRGEWFKYGGIAATIIELMLADADVSALNDIRLSTNKRLSRVVDYARLKSVSVGG